MMRLYGCALLLLLISGCRTPMTLDPSGAGPGLVVSHVTYPSTRDSQTRFDFRRKDITILGPVSTTAESTNIMLIWSAGDNGYGNLLRAARAAYPQADGVIDVQWDSQFNNICIPCYIPIPVIQKVTSKIEGKAFRFKR